MKAIWGLGKRDVSILIGNALDHFDTLLYGFLAPVLAPIFFPQYDPVVQLILAYSLLAASVFTRPLGALLFGMLANFKGPLVGLYLSLLGVAVTTFAIGCLPTYAGAGWFAPFGLTLLRMVRGIFAAGESTISKLYILEGKPEDGALLASYAYQSSTMAGTVFASLLVAVIGFTDEPALYWRWPFLLGGVTALAGLYLRRTVKVVGKRAGVKIGWRGLGLLWRERVGLVRVALAASFSYLTYAVPFVFMNSFVPELTDISLGAMMGANTGFLVFDLVAIPVIGYWTRSYRPVLVMAAAALVLAMTLVPLFMGLAGCSMLFVTGLRLWIVVWGLVFLGPLNVWFAKQFEGEAKYLLVGVGYNLGAATLGRSLPAVLLLLWHFTGSVIVPAGYLVVLSGLTLLALKGSRG